MRKRHPKQTVRKTSAVDACLARPGGLSYLEIPAIDIRKSVAFYEKVLGWKVRDRDADRCKFTDQTGHLIGSWVMDRAVHRKPGWLPYMYVDRIRVAVKRVAAHGGKIVKAPYPEGNLLVAVVRDPAGNLLGLWQDASL